MNRLTNFAVATLLLGSVAHADPTPPATPATPTPAAPPALSELPMLQSTIGEFRPGSIPDEMTEKAAFLGIGAMPVDPPLASQLDLPRGLGLSVLFVEPGSPAAKAGMEIHDVLTKVNDQLLFNGEQLAALIRYHKAGDVIKLTMLRKGKPVTLSATLIDRQMPLLGLPTINISPGPMAAAPSAPGLFPEPPRDQSPRVIRMMPGARSVVIRTEGDQTLRLSIAKGERWLQIKGKDDAVLFEGSIKEPEEIDALAPEWREKVKGLIDGIDIQIAPSTQPTTPKAELTVDGTEVAT